MPCFFASSALLQPRSTFVPAAASAVLLLFGHIWEREGLSMPPLPLPLLVSTPEADLGDGRQGEWRVREGVSRLRDVMSHGLSRFIVLGYVTST